MPITSYAQNFEDVMLWRALESVDGGFWIDVGASDPDKLSVTRAFSEHGWRGINIEPADRPFKLLQAQRPHDINLQTAVGETCGEIELFVVDGGNGLTTVDPDAAAVQEKAGYDITRLSVGLTTLAQICDDHVDGPVHFLKIDVEGFEHAVLAGANFGRTRPWVVLVEAVAPLSQRETYAEWEHYLLDADYRFVYFDGLNRFYLAAERFDELARHFTIPPNVFDDYVLAGITAARAGMAVAEARAAAFEARAVAFEAIAADAEAETAETAYKLFAAEAATRQAQAQTAAAYATARAAEAREQAMMRSTSWRITRIFRSVAYRGRRLLDRPGLRLVRSSIRVILRPLLRRPVPAAPLLPSPEIVKSYRLLSDEALMALRLETAAQATAPLR